MKLHLKIEKRAMVGRTKDLAPNDEYAQPVDDSFATFQINGLAYQSESPQNSGIAETINRDLEQLERATA